MTRDSAEIRANDLLASEIELIPVMAAKQWKCFKCPAKIHFAGATVTADNGGGSKTKFLHK